MEFPNVLIIMTDQLNAKSSHLYGNSISYTPNMERLANEGVLFEHAFTPHPLCVPARVSFWTSQYSHMTGARTNQSFMPAGVRHTPRIWKELGYHVGLIGKNHCFDTQEDLSLFDTWCEISHHGLPPNPDCRGMEWFRPISAIQAAQFVRNNMPYVNDRFSYAYTGYPLEDYSTGLIAGQAIRFLEDHATSPFALWVSFPDPHPPWEVPEEYASLFPPNQMLLPFSRPDEFSDGSATERNIVLHRMMGIDNVPVEQTRDLLAAYYGMVRFIDDALGQILDALENLGLKEKTIVVFCSDHGDFMGEHQLQAKGGVFYDCLTRVPLLLSWPGHIPAGEREGHLVSLLDIMPTLLQLQKIPIPEEMEGQLLPSIFSVEARQVVISEYGAGGQPFRLSDLENMPQPYGRRTFLDSLEWREAEGLRKMVRTLQWKYVHDPLGDLDELYDLLEDPGELYNLAAKPEYSQIILNLRSRFTGWNL